MRGLISVLALLPALAAQAADFAAGGASFVLPVTSLKEARFRTTVRQQYDFSCGSAALATLLSHHYDFPVTEQEIFRDMFGRGDQPRIRREGFSLLDMKRYLATRGFTADGFEQPLDKLAQAGLPAIVLVADNGYRHFVVIKGVQGDRVLLGDPAGGTRALPRQGFEAIWQNRLLFVIHGRPGKPHFNETADWRVAPQALLSEGIMRDSLRDVTVPKLGTSDF
ncbi:MULTISPECIES: C39 family peptidase [unclassified Duganella]|uniref:C39 family peptidase n=1 Tax=unclassified Duganella TaxID=2636909 RepID=UPI0006FBF342|nr:MULTISPECIES: C39 family peptidase [unclassified Duganella]KQV59862.1 peptidase C39 [Duganella sp. Root336D2]KRB87338.1 peptidase C39 [Duganella sp. Root198D2]